MVVAYSNGSRLPDFGSVGGGGGVSPSWLGYDGSKDSARVLSVGIIPSTSDPIDASVLTTSRAVSVCKDTSNSNHGTMELIDVSGTAPVVLDTFVFSAFNQTTEARVCRLDDRYCLVLYVAGSLKARVIDTNGDTLSVVGSEQSPSITATPNALALAGIDDTRSLVGYRNSSNQDLEAMILSVNTGTGVVTTNTAVTIRTTTIEDFPVGANVFSTTDFLLTAREGGNDVVLGTANYSGTTISNPVSTNLQTVSNIFPTDPQISSDSTVVYTNFADADSTRAAFTNSFPLTVGTPSVIGTGIKRCPSSPDRASILVDSIGDIDYGLGFGVFYDVTQPTFQKLAFQGLGVDKNNSVFTHGGSINFIDRFGATENENNITAKKVTSSKIFVVYKGDVDNDIAYYIANL